MPTMTEPTTTPDVCVVNIATGERIPGAWGTGTYGPCFCPDDRTLGIIFPGRAGFSLPDLNDVWSLLLGGDR